MSLYTLDTDAFTLFRMGHAQVAQQVIAHASTDLALTVISVEELLTGWYTQLRRATNRNDVARAYQRLTDQAMSMSGWRVLSFTLPAILRYEQLLALKLNVRKPDLRIAAIALENSATLVTRNFRDFQRVPGLTLEDWSK